MRLSHDEQMAGWRQIRNELSQVFMLDPEASERMQTKLAGFIADIDQHARELAESRAEVEKLLALVKELTP